MWWPNILITVLGIVGLIWVSHQSGSTRDSAFPELVDRLQRLGRRAAGRA